MTRLQQFATGSTKERTKIAPSKPKRAQYTGKKAILHPAKYIQQVQTCKSVRGQQSMTSRTFKKEQWAEHLTLISQCGGYEGDSSSRVAHPSRTFNQTKQSKNSWGEKANPRRLEKANPWADRSEHEERSDRDQVDTEDQALVG